MDIDLYVDLFEETKNVAAQAQLHELLAKSETDNLIAARHIEISRIYWGTAFRNYEILTRYYDFTSSRSKIMLHRNAAWSAFKSLDYQSALRHVELARSYEGHEKVGNYLDFIDKESNRNLTAASILKNSSFHGKTAS